MESRATNARGDAPDLAVADLVERCRAGDQLAATALVARYAQRLVRVAEHHLDRRVSARADGEDVMQSVFRTFFRRCAANEFAFDGSGGLWRLLVTITVRKAHAVNREHRAGKRAVGAEATLSQAALAETLAREPGPAEAAALVDQLDAILVGLPPLYAQLLERRLQGEPITEIADSLGVSRRTLHRALHLLQNRLLAIDSSLS